MGIYPLSRSAVTSDPGSFPSGSGNGLLGEATLDDLGPAFAGGKLPCGTSTVILPGKTGCDEAALLDLIIFTRCLHATSPWLEPEAVVCGVPVSELASKESDSPDSDILVSATLRKAVYG